MLSVFGAALALAYAAVPSLPAAIVALAAALHVPTITLSLIRRRVPPVVLTIVQLPISIGMFTLLRQLAHGRFGAVPPSTGLAAALRTGHALHVGGVDLTTTGLAALAAGPWSIAAAVAIGLGVALVLAARRPGTQAQAQAQAQAPAILTLLPAATVLFLPLAVTIFVAASSILRAASGRLLS